MKHKLSFCIVCAFLLTLAQPAFARYGYFGIRGGFSDTHENNEIKKYRSVGFGSGYLGVSAEALRAEAEYTYTAKTDYKNFKQPLEANFKRASGNIYLDIPATRYFCPYVGGGVGTVFYSVKDKGNKDKKSGTNFAWNIGGGLGVKLTRNVTFDTGYRYVDMGEATTENHQLDFSAHEAYCGIRFLF